MSFSRRSFVIGAAATILASEASGKAGKSQPRLDALTLDDASQLNATPISRHWIVDDSDARLIEDLRRGLAEAAQAGRSVAFGGARHSMGGQSLPRDGFAASFARRACIADPAARSYHAGAGTRWRDVIRTLDPLGFSVAVMQSNHDFSVGGTLSVNAHGWPVPFGPFGTTIRSFRLMLADGSVVTCSRTENEELFRLVIGGYGLFGVVVDAQLDMVENSLLRPELEQLPSSHLATRFIAAINKSTVSMAYGRLSVARQDFLKHALLVTFRRDETNRDPTPPARSSSAMSAVSRSVFRAQTGSEQGKRSRWYAETVLAPSLANTPVTRNTLINEPVEALAGYDSRRVDILHEYFVPPDRFNDFLAGCRDIIPRFRQDLLNVTLRYVGADDVSVLAFAPEPRIAAVMLFSQWRTKEADEDMRLLTESLIDQTLNLGGSFYLPYRLHARVDQIEKAYPRLSAFLAKKRYYDPKIRFRNLMWDRYFDGVS